MSRCHQLLLLCDTWVMVVIGEATITAREELKDSCK
jgi:hypothetical protein